MIGKLLPVLLVVLGLGGGIGAGYALQPPKPAAKADAADCAPPAEKPELAAEGHGGGKDEKATAHDYVKLNNQFVVPVVENGAVASLVVLSISLEVALGQSEAVYEREPKLRDAFLQVLFDHANAGGFEDNFTGAAPMSTLRRSLREIAAKTLGPVVNDVLIMSIVRQDA